MPQLSPLNWVLLFALFWIAVLTMSVLIWWSNKVYFQGENLDSVDTKENKWNW
uniref:ATP synthase complex subunit 8 n=1 Tax=Brunneifusus ternatanus TaxID=311536 RepID=A0A8A3T749_9CAEN|nr:ATP synthase F0 subunit 8 [Brunneifusus ternatanus]QTA29864.1 ATP synthase F0 subunit 8 [Brunneifusus ternatanus]